MRRLAWAALILALTSAWLTAARAEVAGDAPSDGDDSDEPPVFEVFRVLPQWVVRAEKRPSGYTACDARAFDQDHDTAMGIRLDGTGAFSMTLASPQDLVPPGFSRPNDVDVAMPYGQAWRFHVDMQGGYQEVNLVPEDGFGLAYALTRGWQVEVQVGTLILQFRLRGVADGVTALGECVRLFINPNLDLPPLLPPAEPLEVDG